MKPRLTFQVKASLEWSLRFFWALFLKMFFRPVSQSARNSVFKYSLGDRIFIWTDIKIHALNYSHGWDGTTNLAGFPPLLQAYPLAHYYIQSGQGRNSCLLFFFFSWKLLDQTPQKFEIKLWIRMTLGEILWFNLFRSPLFFIRKHKDRPCLLMKAGKNKQFRVGLWN